jgi:molybdopterin converting factor small subunit
MSTVRIPPVLRAQAGDQKAIEVEGATVGAVLETLVTRFPALRGQLLGPDGDLHRFVNVYLNDQDVRYLDALATPVHERDTITVLPAMAGGAG